MKIKEHPTIFIHGYNVSFSESVKRAAQLGHDLGLGQGIGLFSWPSKGRIGSYSADEASSEASKYLLAEHIYTFTSNSEKGRVNIIAHSMGCRCLIGALEILANGRTNTLKKINQIILAAADIDAATMPYQIKRTLKYCTRTTSYISDQDNALKVSGWLHEFPRIGITPPTFVSDGLDTVLVNDSQIGESSHSYLGENRSVLNDIFELLKRNTNPTDRFSIEPVLSIWGDYWKIKN
nr:alpha/beta hydrolase [Marinicella sp. W31]MDC2878067.1 alpha/beta hydrolase [Marinicella sp. W31]